MCISYIMYSYTHIILYNNDIIILCIRAPGRRDRCFDRLLIIIINRPAHIYRPDWIETYYTRAV